MCILRKVSTHQPKQTGQANPDGHFSPHVDFLFRESLPYTSFPLKRNVSARISLHRLHRLVWVDTLRNFHNVLVFSLNGSYVRVPWSEWYVNMPVVRQRSQSFTEFGLTNIIMHFTDIWNVLAVLSYVILQGTSIRVSTFIEIPTI